MNDATSSSPHNRHKPRGKGAGTSSLTVTEGRRGPTYSFHHPINITVWDMEAKWQPTILYTVTFYHGRAKWTRARYHPHVSEAPLRVSAELTPKTGQWLKRVDFYLQICHWPDGWSWAKKPSPLLKWGKTQACIKSLDENHHCVWILRNTTLTVSSHACCSLHLAKSWET